MHMILHTEVMKAFPSDERMNPNLFQKKALSPLNSPLLQL